MVKQRARSLRFTESEEAEIRSYAQLTGEQEAVLLERVSIKGLRHERLEKGLLTYLDTRDSTHAAHVAGVSRLALLREAADRGMAVGDAAPEELFGDLSRAAELLGNERLAAAVRSAARRSASEPI